MSVRDDAVDVAWNAARDRSWRPEPGLEDQARSLHRALDGYAPTPLLAAPSLAAELGLGAVLLKDESSRFGLPSFKALGAWWATAWALAERLGEPALATQPEALRERARGSGLTLVCATEGNHGRAVARFARGLGLAARVVMTEGSLAARVRPIEADGARVELVEGGYDAAVHRAAGLADECHLVIADTSWPGYEEVPRRVVEAYATIFVELDGQLDGRSVDLVVIPIGVGSLAAAAARHFRATPGDRPRLVGLEPRRGVCAGVGAGREAGQHRWRAQLDHGRPELPHAVIRRLAAARRRVRRVLRGRRRTRAVGDPAAGGRGPRSWRLRGRRRRRPARAPARSGPPRRAGPARGRDRAADPDRGRDRPDRDHDASAAGRAGGARRPRPRHERRGLAACARRGLGTDRVRLVG